MNNSASCFSCGEDADRYVAGRWMCRKCVHRHQVVAIAIATEDTAMLERLYQEAC